MAAIFWLFTIEIVLRNPIPIPSTFSWFCGNHIAGAFRVCEGDSLVLTTATNADLYEWQTAFQTTVPKFIINNIAEGGEATTIVWLKRRLFSTSFEVKFVTVDSETFGFLSIDGNKVLCFGDTLKLKTNVIQAYKMRIGKVPMALWWARGWRWPYQGKWHPWRVIRWQCKKMDAFLLFRSLPLLK